MWGPTWESKSKGQSSPIAIVLVFGLVIASTTVVVLAGGSAIQSTQSQLGTVSAEKSMTQLDSQASLVALGQSGSQRVDLGTNTDGGYRVDETAGKMTVEHRKAATTDVIFSKELGAVTHESGDGTTIAYQGGGVWRSTGPGESVMVSPPEFHYRGSTLTLPVVTINHGEQITDRAVIRRNDTTQHYPNGTNLNPVDNGRIFVTVKSAYYRAWGAYFEERTDGVVEYDDPNNEVTIELVTPIGQTTTSSAVAGLSSGDLKTEGNGGAPCGYSSGFDKFYTDSYNSSGTTDDYCDQYPGSTSKDGNVTFGGNVDYQGNANFYGNIRSGGDVDLTGNAVIEGDVYWTSSYSEGGSANVAGTDGQISGVKTQSKINRIVGSNGNRIADANDNDDANDAYDAVTTAPDPEVNFGGVGSTVEIDNDGEYHLKRLDIGSGQTVVLDTDDGDITIVVDEYVNVDGTLEVDGDNTVRIYVRTMGASGKVGTGGWRDAGLKIHGGDVTVPDDNSPQLRFYGNDTLNASVQNGQLTGVIWAPVGAGGPGGFRVKQSDVYGGVVTGDVLMDTKGRIHYDQALKQEQVISPDESVTEITYLHVSTNEINITSG